MATSDSITRPISYIPAIDGLRFIAVFLVIPHHWFVNHKLHLNYNGLLGVTLFFVISGYLITSIILKYKSKSTKRTFLKAFYLRRSIRIFPVYYFLIGILFLFNVQEIRDKIFWFLFYIQNHYFISINSWDGSLNHFWSLAVEEQFYLFWPLIMLSVKNKYLDKAVVSLIVFSLIFKLLLFYFKGNKFIGLYMFSNFDAFAIGGALACHKYINAFKFLDGDNKTAFVVRIFTFLFVVAYLSLHISYMMGFIDNSFVSNVLMTFMMSIFSLILIIYSTKHPFKPVLQSYLFVQLGKISYGIYLFHMFAPEIYSFLNRIAFKYNLFIPFTETLIFPVFQSIAIKTFIYLSITLLLSIVSWNLLELPINKLKRNFKYY